jgi:hypothetical protein
MLRAPRGIAAVDPLPPDWVPRFLGKCEPVCTRRRYAMIDGDLMFDFDRHGWIDPHSYYSTGVLHVDCPYCGAELPTEDEYKQQMLSDAGEGWEG